MKRLTQYRWARALLPALAGLLGYGGWAFVINGSHGVEAAWRAACTQGGYSFVLTLVLSLLMEWLYLKLQHHPRARIWVIAITCCLLYTTSWSINVLRGTPEVLLTILPGAIASTLYSVAYVTGIAKLHAAPDLAVGTKTS